jgi:hypothetical protein
MIQISNAVHSSSKISNEVLVTDCVEFLNRFLPTMDERLLALGMEAVLYKTNLLQGSLRKRFDVLFHFIQQCFQSLGGIKLHIIFMTPYARGYPGKPLCSGSLIYYYYISGLKLCNIYIDEGELRFLEPDFSSVYANYIKI